MPARRTPRHRARTTTLRALLGRRTRPRSTRRLGPPLLLAAVLVTSSLTMATPSDAGMPSPSATTVDR